VKAVNTGSLAWALGSAFGYFYMVSAWGGYVFIINLVPLYVLVLLVTGRYSLRLYVAYNCMYVLGMLLAMQIRFVGFQHVQSGEHMAAMGVFFLLQVGFFSLSVYVCLGFYLGRKIDAVVWVVLKKGSRIGNNVKFLFSYLDYCTIIGNVVVSAAMSRLLNVSATKVLNCGDSFDGILLVTGNFGQMCVGFYLGQNLDAAL